ncbi:hypothetical protein BASA83_011009 [Batrachochytrium salamandrivorans]|nr:hypothetical protein BASA83_011009 [Batrachochytrium salamandrivorans]
MPLGLASAPAQFQRMMNTLFRDSIGKFVLVYLDDIVVYSEDLETHKEHVKSVLDHPLEQTVFIANLKVSLHQQEISYLGYVISPNGIVWTLKSESLARLATPRKLRDIQCFLGSLISIDSHPRLFNMTCHLTKLLKKDTPFSWGADQEKSINDLKKAFSNSSFLAHPCDSKPFILETDASDFAISGVLSQFDDLDQIRPVAFYARQMNSAERNYESTIKNSWLSLIRSSTGDTFCKVVSIQSRYSATTKV